MTKTFIYRSYKFPRLLNFFLENFFLVPLTYFFRFLVVTQNHRSIRLGYQQILKINQTDTPALIQKKIDQNINNPNLYFYCPPAKHSLALFFLLPCLFLFLIKLPPRQPQNFNPVRFHQLVLNLVPQSACLFSVGYHLNLNSPPSLLLNIKFCPDQNKIVVLNLPDQFLLQSINWNGSPAPASHFMIKNRQLYYNLIATADTDNLLSIKLSRQTLPKNFILMIVLPENLFLSSHQLDINYPSGTSLSLNQKPVFAEAGHLRYNLPLSDNYYLTIQHD